MMEKIKLITKTKELMLDTITPVSIFLKFRDKYEDSVLLESSDYQASHNSSTFIGLKPMATFQVTDFKITEEYPNGEVLTSQVTKKGQVAERLEGFIKQFDSDTSNPKSAINGVFGYMSYDSVQYFEDLKLTNTTNDDKHIPEIRYSVYKYIITINHFHNDVFVLENLLEGETSRMDEIIEQLYSQNTPTYKFFTDGNETSNMTDNEFKDLVRKGKEHCFRGDVFQIVLSRMFQQKYKGDEFNVYRALRSINPSPYLFYFDYGSYRLFGSSPEAQVMIKNNRAIINPIAGTYRRTGNDDADRLLAEKLLEDPKENAEHTMLVDLARNDLSRNANKVTVDTYKAVQYYSHVIHLVSTVSGELLPNSNFIKVLGECSPAGTLSGAPKVKAMQLIDKYETGKRSYYGGCIGPICFNGNINQAIMIRTFISKNNTLSYQAGAGVVALSDEESEMQEVKNKLMALKKAIDKAVEL